MGQHPVIKPARGVPETALPRVKSELICRAIFPPTDSSSEMFRKREKEFRKLSQT